MLIVDTHCHALPHWFEPVEVLLHQMHANGVEKQGKRIWKLREFSVKVVGCSAI